MQPRVAAYLAQQPTDTSPSGQVPKPGGGGCIFGGLELSAHRLRRPNTSMLCSTTDMATAAQQLRSRAWTSRHSRLELTPFPGLAGRSLHLLVAAALALGVPAARGPQSVMQDRSQSMRRWRTRRNKKTVKLGAPISELPTAPSLVSLRPPDRCRTLAGSSSIRQRNTAHFRPEKTLRPSWLQVATGACLDGLPRSSRPILALLDGRPVPLVKRRCALCRPTGRLSVPQGQVGRDTAETPHSASQLGGGRLLVAECTCPRYHAPPSLLADAREQTEAMWPSMTAIRINPG